VAGKATKELANREKKDISGEKVCKPLKQYPKALKVLPN
jgi:hypothetical protein